MSCTGLGQLLDRHDTRTLLDLLSLYLKLGAPRVPGYLPRQVEDEMIDYNNIVQDDENKVTDLKADAFGVAAAALFGVFYKKGGIMEVTIDHHEMGVTPVGKQFIDMYNRL